MSARFGVMLAALAASACSGGESGASAGDLDADARALAAIVAADPATAVIDDVGAAIDTDRPVRGSDLLAELGLPAMRRQVTLVEDLHPATTEGRALRARAIRLYRARVAAYEVYRPLLSRGLLDDEALLDALDTVSENEREILALQYELSHIAPIGRGGAPPADDEPDLAGLPPVGRVPPPADDETPGEEPEGRVENPAVLEDALPEM